MSYHLNPRLHVSAITSALCCNNGTQQWTFSGQCTQISLPLCDTKGYRPAEAHDAPRVRVYSVARENQNTLFMFSNVCTENRAVFEIMKDFVVSQATDDNIICRMRFAYWITYGYILILGMYSTYCFSTATVVTRTRLIVTFMCTSPVLLRHAAVT